jgi:GT2 family glycosyltransferase
LLLSCGKVDVSRCITSVVQNSNDFRLIWIDNAPDTANPHRDVFTDKVFYLPMQENIGFTKGVNVGLAISTAPYVVILNDDVQVPAGWLPKMEKGFERLSPSAVRKVAAVGTLSTSRAQGQGVWPADLGPQEVSPKLSLAGSAIGGPMLAFFCTMFSREAIEQVGYLDEIFSPGFGEDDDWCARAHLAGWKLVVQTDVRVQHQHHASWDPQRRAELQRRNCKRLREKYSGVIR